MSALLLAVAGCARDATEADDLTTAPRWTLREEMRIGSADDPDIGFSRVAGMVLDSAGELYVLDSAEQQVRVFDEAGRLVRRIGQRGAGPGELEAPFDLGLVGDTLWVTQWGSNPRLTLFSTDGSLITTVPAWPTSFTGNTGRVIVTLFPGSLEPGGIAISRETWTMRGADTVVFPQVRFDLRGQIIDTIGWDTLRMGGPSRERLNIAGVDGPMPGLPSLFDDEPITAARGRVRVERPLPTSAESGSFTVTRIDAAGDTLFARRYRYAPLAVSPAQIDEAAAIAGEVFRLRGVDSAVVDAEIRRVLEVPPFLPPVTEARLVGGEVWLLREDVIERPRRWTVLDGTGVVAGEFELPSSATPRIFQADRLWVVELDELDVPWVVRYRIVRAGPTRAGH